MKLKFFLTFSLLILLCFSGCKKTESIKIGLNIEETGNNPEFGASCLKSAQLFVHQINQCGGVTIGNHKFPLEIIEVNNNSQADQAALATHYLISQKNVLFMIGPNMSSCALPAAEIAESLHCLMISPWSTSPKTTINTTTGQTKKYVFRSCFTDTAEVPYIADFIFKRLKLSNASVLYEISSEAPVSQANIFNQIFKKLGGNVIKMETYTSGDHDFFSQITNIKNASHLHEVEVLFIPSYYNDPPLIAAQAHQLGFNPIFFGGDGWGTPKIIPLDRAKNLEGSYLCEHFSNDQLNKKSAQFVKDYEETYHEKPDNIAALTYDSLSLALMSLKVAQKINREAITEAMSKINRYSGVTGEFYYPKGSHDPEKTVFIVQIKNGHFQLVQTMNPNPR